ncbi:unnamed protein product [Arabidopsis halleri]
MPSPIALPPDRINCSLEHIPSYEALDLTMPFVAGGCDD